MFEKQPSIRAMREEIGLTQQELAELTGVKRTTIAMLETNPGQKPSVKTAKKLCMILPCSWFDFYR